MSNGAKQIIDEELVGECHKCVALAMADALREARGQLTEEQVETLIENDQRLLAEMRDWLERRALALGE